MKVEVATVAIVDGSKILILRRAKTSSHPGSYNFPGGKVEKGESLEFAAVREVKEETNLVLKDIDLNYIGSIDEKYLTIHFFITDKFSNEVSINKESDEFIWTEIQDLGKYSFVGGSTLNPDLLKEIKHYISYVNKGK